jgi:hypothetical protein
MLRMDEDFDWESCTASPRSPTLLDVSRGSIYRRVRAAESPGHRGAGSRRGPKASRSTPHVVFPSVSRMPGHSDG